MSWPSHVLVMAKAPVPGRVKTRLCPPCSPEEAAALAAAALADTLEAVAGCGAARKVLALDGEPGPWLPAGFELIPQRGAGLDERLANAWRHMSGPGLQLGMDTPHVGSDELDGLLNKIREGTALLGPAVDGGWWVIGLPASPSFDPALAFHGVPMSAPDSGTQQKRRLQSIGLDVVEAPLRRDIDTVADLVAVALEAPTTRIARLAGQLGLIVGAA